MERVDGFELGTGFEQAKMVVSRHEGLCLSVTVS